MRCAAQTVEQQTAKQREERLRRRIERERASQQST